MNELRSRPHTHTLGGLPQDKQFSLEDMKFRNKMHRRY